MREFIGEVLDVLRAFLRECRTQAGLVLLAYTLIMCTHHAVMDQRALQDWLSFVPWSSERLIRKLVLDVVLFGAVPMVLVAAVHRRSLLRDFGLRWPERRWVLLTGGIFGIQLAGIVIAAHIPALRDFYPMFRQARAGGAVFWGFSLLQFASMVAWEFVNRGYLLLGLRERMGMAAVLVQVVPFGILHFGKPTLELYWSVADGLGLALLAWASASIWPAVFLHGVGAFLLDVALVYVFPR